MQFKVLFVLLTLVAPVFSKFQQSKVVKRNQAKDESHGSMSKAGSGVAHFLANFKGKKEKDVQQLSDISVSGTFKSILAFSTKIQHRVTFRSTQSHQ
jgi:hypothetical protein